MITRISREEYDRAVHGGKMSQSRSYFTYNDKFYHRFPIIVGDNIFVKFEYEEEDEVLAMLEQKYLYVDNMLSVDCILHGITLHNRKYKLESI
jgi:hypothetical protein